MQNRKKLRKQLKERRNALLPSVHEKFSIQACQSILQSTLWEKSRSVGLYVATHNELETKLLLDSILQLYSKPSAGVGQKNLVLPVCKRGNPQMRLVECQSLNDLSPDEFGILSPSWAAKEIVPDILIMPLLGYDKNGGRLGYGGGYYDRLCVRPDFATTFRLGLAFSCQEVPSVFAQSWDVPLHAVCTENGLHFFASAQMLLDNFSLR